MKSLGTYECIFERGKVRITPLNHKTGYPSPLTMQTGKITPLAQSAAVLVLHGSPFNNSFNKKNLWAPHISSPLLSISILYPQSLLLNLLPPLTSSPARQHREWLRAGEGGGKHSLLGHWWRWLWQRRWRSHGWPTEEEVARAADGGGVARSGGRRWRAGSGGGWGCETMRGI